MRWILFLSLSLFVTTTFSQIEPFMGLNKGQSSNSYSWKSLENNYVEVLFPEGWESEAQRSAFLVEHYARVVGKSLKIENPQKFPLILRPEMALPNGFVALAPRRSEWFVNHAFSPFLGGLDFMDVLSIHEYRHINQFDFSYRSTNKLGYFLFGEYGLALLNSIGMPSWYFEGDAVWAETKYTSAGRGRSPRFSARLKAMLLSGQIPSYDELVGKSYKTIYPNHYVYGYYIVARAYRLFGDDFWYRVFNGVADFAINPYRIYTEFELLSGVSFEKFVEETFIELREDWIKRGDTLAQVKEPDFIEKRFPLRNGQNDYYFEKKLNGFWTLKKGEVEIRELAIRPDLSKVDIQKDRLVFTQFLPDTRFDFKGYSDLFIYDIKEDDLKRITEKRILYHPQWSPEGNEVIVIEKGGAAQLSLKRFKGGKWSSLPFELGIPLEFSYRNSRELYVLFQNKKGERSIALYNLSSQRAQKLSPFTRINIYSLRSFSSDLLFEGDWQGRVQIILMTPKGEVKVCTKVPVMARTPMGIGEKIKFASTHGNGEIIKEVDASECRLIAADDFWDQREGQALSISSFGNSLAQEYDLSNLKELEVKEASSFTRGLAPHSWSFIGGRGFQFQIQGANYLGDLSYLAVVGQDSAEKKPFGEFHLSYNKYLIMASLYGIYEQRDTRLSTLEGDKEWNEVEYGLRLTLPLTWQRGFYYTNFRLSAHVSKIEVSDRYGSYSYRTNDEGLDAYGAGLSFSSLKKKRFQEIYPRWGGALRGFYRDVSSDRRADYGTSLTYLEGLFYLPGLWQNAGFKIRGVGEFQGEGLNNYRHSPVNEDLRSYVLSRGFDYHYVDKYIKGSADYAFPLLNSDWNLAGWHYIRRLYLNLFYDQTRAELLGHEFDLKSFGGELNFDATWFRRLPLNYGIRYSKKIESKQRWDFFLGTELSF